MQAPNMHRNLAGYCGIYCGACSIYCLHKRGLATQQAPSWTDLPRELQDHLPFGPAPVQCRGCRSDEVFIGCAHCHIRACAKKRGIENSCAECKRYPCFRYALLRLLVWVTSLEKKLPHIRNRQAQREQMVQLRVDPWLKRQNAHWRCPDCGMRFSWYEKTCSICARELSSLDRFDVVDSREPDNVE